MSRDDKILAIWEVGYIIALILIALYGGGYIL